MNIYFSDSVRTAALMQSRSLGQAAEDTIPESGPASYGTDPGLGIIARAAVRESRESGSVGTLAADQTYYMDVGVWGIGSSGRATTSFGLISGPDFLLCSWKNDAEGGAAFQATQNAAGQAYTFSTQTAMTVGNWWQTLAPGARNFLQQAHSSGRGFVLAAARASFNFTDPDSPVLVLPDLHLRLRNGRPLDLFRYRTGSTYRSLDDELANVLSLARRLGVETAQAGDMYETWETEILCRLQQVDLYDFVASTLRLASTTDPTDSLRHDYRTMVQRHLTLLEMLNSDRNWRQWADAHTTPMSVSAVEQGSVDFTSTEAIEAAIRAAHPPLFPSGRTSLTDHDVIGNHDNNHPNRYWSSTYVPSRYREHEHLRPGTQASSSDTRPDHVRLGLNNCLWIEHGHNYDWHNNDIRWSASDYAHWYHDAHGFDLVQTMVYMGRGSQWRVDQMRWMGDIVADVTDYEMRHFTLLRVDDLLRNQQGLAGVVLGHTHEPCLLEVPRGTSYFWLHPHASHYIGSGYCLPQAITLARSLPHA